MRKYIIILLVFLSACAPATPAPPIEGTVADKQMKEAWSTSEHWYYSCGYDAFEAETKCGYRLHALPKVTHYPAQYHIALVNGTEGEWIDVSECVYNILDVGEFYSSLENYGCEQ